MIDAHPGSPLGRLLHRPGGLDLERARSRTSAFVYGNTTVLAAVLTADAESTLGGRAALVVAVTALLTFAAHVVADAVSATIGRTAEGAHASLVHELRDAGPIATSGALPAVLLLLGALGVLSTTSAQLLAALVVVLRLAATGLVVQRLGGRPPSAAALWSGLALAVVSTVVAGLKAVFGH